MSDQTQEDRSTQGERISSAENENTTAAQPARPNIEDAGQSAGQAPKGVSATADTQRGHDDVETSDDMEMADDRFRCNDEDEVDEVPEMFDKNGNPIPGVFERMFGIEPIFTEEEREADPRAVVTWLTELRHRRELTQEHIAEFMNCTASRISRIESGDDRHLSVSEAAEYVEALGLSCTLKVYDDEMPMDVQLRRTILETTRLLCRLRRLLKFRGEKAALVRVERFIGGAMSELFIEVFDGDLPARDAARGAMHAELAPGA